MKISKKTAAVITAASLLAVGNICTMPKDAVKDFMLSVSAAESDIVASGTCGIYGDNLTWELDSEDTLTISGEGAMNNWEYSSDIPWDSHRYNIVSVVIEDGVTSIGDDAFCNCDSLTSITLPDSLTSIGDEAFLSCNGLTSITLPDSLTSIGDMAFSYCDLTSIIIPDSVTSIAGNAFNSCNDLTSINVDSNNKYYASEDGVLFNKDKSILIQFPEAKPAEEYVIPDGVTTIGNSAFEECESLTSITIPDSVTTIGDEAFYDCGSLTSIILPDGVTTIGDEAFYDCGSLTSIILPDGVTSIGDSAFAKCERLTSITIPDGVTSIGNSAFDSCDNLTSITIPDSVTSIGDDAFWSCDGLTSITLPDSLTSIGNYAFSHCDSLTSITLPDSLTSIGDKAFSYCDGLTSITIPDSVTTIGKIPFSNCDNLPAINVESGNKYYASEDGVLFNKDKSVLLEFPVGKTVKEYYVPDSVTAIEDEAFAYCIHVSSIIVPDSVMSIGEDAFYINSFQIASLKWGDFFSVTIENPECVIYDSSKTICNHLVPVEYDMYAVEYKFSGVIYGHKGSTAQAYANRYGSRFELIAPLSIVKQPASVVVPNGEKASVTVNATGDGLTYKWYYKNKGMTKFVESTSMTSATYSVDKMTALRDGRQLYCVITDKYGNSVKTDTVTLFIGNALKITAQPESVVVPNGKKASVTVKATGNGLTYKWYYKNKGMTKFVESTSMTSATYSVDKMTSARDGRQLYCVITDLYGNSVKTDTVTLSIANELKITAQPESVTVPSGKKASVTVSATGDGLTYKWYYKNKGMTKFVESTSMTSATYSVDKMTASRDGRQLYCVITDKYGNSVKTDTVTLNIGKALKITAQPESVTVANGKKASVTVSATGDGLTYKWYYKNKGASKFSYTSTFTGNKYSVTMSDSRDGRQIYCVITDKYGNSVKTDTVTLFQE